MPLYVDIKYCTHCGKPVDNCSVAKICNACWLKSIDEKLKSLEGLGLDKPLEYN